MDEAEREPKWYIDSVTTAGTLIAANGLFIGKIIDEHLAEVIVTAVNEQSERSALLKCEEALREVIAATRAYLPPDGISKLECINRVLMASDNAEIVSALSLLDEARKDSNND